MMDCCDDVFSDGHGQMQWPFGYFVAVPDSDTAWTTYQYCERLSHKNFPVVIFGIGIIFGIKTMVVADGSVEI